MKPTKLNNSRRQNPVNLNAPSLSVRAQAALLLQQVLQQGRSLATVLPAAQSQLDSSDRAWLQAACYIVFRELPRYEWLANQLIEKPLKKKTRVIHYLIIIGLVQLRALNTPPHAALSETVQAAHELKFKGLKGFVNAVLRNYLRQQKTLDEACALRFSTADCFPTWLKKSIQSSWPEQAEAIFTASQQQAPLWLRVNQQLYSGHEYQQLLEQEGIKATCHPYLTQAVCLQQSMDIRALPGFQEGSCSVQDISAQKIGRFLSQPEGFSQNMRVLDACAAPGGKTALLLEQNPDLVLDALDSDSNRLERLTQNLNRLNLQARIIHGDASQPETWWDQRLYDKILLDAPCSATGIMRRQPDIRWHRQANDIKALVELQAKILRALWPLLKPGGQLLYVTCSILPEENHLQIKNFLQQQPDAKLFPLAPELDARHEETPRSLDLQVLPGVSYDEFDENGDGFYYALLNKSLA